MEFVNLTNYIPTVNQKMDLNKAEAKKLSNNKTSYKLENESGLVWAAPARDDIFYSEWEKVQPAPSKYAVYYKENENTKVIKPKELFEVSDKVLLGMQQGNGEISKQVILSYIRKKYNNPDISHIICEVDNSTDIADLHTLFNTSDVEKVVEGYAKSFSAVFWNYIDEKDESVFQAPSLMIMDSNCMEMEQVVKTVSYQRRKNGADKITGKNSMELNPKEFKKLIDGDITLESAISLLKIEEAMDNQNLSFLIKERLEDFSGLEDAKQVVEQDKIANELYIVLPGDKKAVQQEILSDGNLQKKLENDRLKHTGNLDIYMATYVEMVEEFDKQKYLQPIVRQQNVEKEPNDTQKNSKEDEER